MFTHQDNEFIAWYPNKLETTSVESVWKKSEAAYYVHIPFCTAICDYCGFSVAKLKGSAQADYFKALHMEISSFDRRLAQYEFTCGHIGGGTPSAVDANYLVDILGLINSRFDVREGHELTIEVNPISASNDKLNAYRAAGVNRLSIGIQSFNDRLLNIIGRPHKRSDIENVLASVRAQRWENFSIDIIYGIPGQTVEELVDDLKKVVDANPTHISCFRLEIIPFTVLKLREAAGLLPSRLPQDALSEQFDAVLTFLTDAGYSHYGAFNFAKPGFESVHNRIAFMAPQGEYVGFGNSAYSYIGGNVYCNQADTLEYSATVQAGGQPIAFSKHANAYERMCRFFVLGLKFLKVSRSDFIDHFGVDPELIFGGIFDKLENGGMIERHDDLYCVTKSGLYYINNICKEFFSEENKGSSQYVQFVPTITRKQIEHFAAIASRTAR